ncbi:hypothetical protein ACM66B_006354 [Microbotryomycetes sp. NB124-2]
MAFVPAYEPYRVPGVIGDAGGELTGMASASSAAAPALVAQAEALPSKHAPTKQRRSSKGSVGDDTNSDKHFGDRSCVRCRERRVRCDRAHPVCSRCEKRREACEYPPHTHFDSKQPAPPASKQVQQLEAQLASVQQQLSNQARLGQPLVPGASGSGSASVSSSQPLTPTPASTAQLVLDCILPSSATEQFETAADFLGVDLVDWQQQSLGWHTTSAAVGEALVNALLDASTLVCCARMPASRNLVSKVTFYKAALHALDSADQLAVLVLCSLGCRSSTRSELLGYPSCPLDADTVPPTAFLPAGVARDAACDALRRLMRDVCWTGDLLQSASWKSLQSLAGLTELLAFEEVQAKDNHFYLRNAIGMWLDLVNSPAEDGGVSMPQRMLGTSLFIDDAYMSAFSRTKPLFFDSHIDRELRTSGINVPSFQSPRRLAHIYDSLIGSHGPIDLESFTQALDIASIYVTQCFRTLANLRSSRDNVHDVAVGIRSLYSNIDETHASIQRFQQSLVNLSQHLGSTNAHDPDATNHLILLAVRLDLDLVELVSHIHLFLEEMAPTAIKMQQDARYQAQNEFGRTKAEGELRLRKCLRLSAFYAKLYLTSADKHVLFHLFNALELVSDWTAIAGQRVGSAGGPISDEYEVSFEELENLRRAMHLCCFYTPRAFTRVREFGHYDSASWAPARLLAPGMPSFSSDDVASSAHQRQQSHVSTSTDVNASRPSTSSTFADVHASTLDHQVPVQQHQDAGMYFYPSTASPYSTGAMATSTSASQFVSLPSPSFHVDPEVLLASPAPAIGLSEHVMDGPGVSRTNQYMTREMHSSSDAIIARSQEAPLATDSAVAGSAQDEDRTIDLMDRLMMLPFDIFFEICSYLEGHDLIHLAEVNKSMHKFMTSKDQVQVWRALRKELETIPVPELSDVAFVLFACSWRCQCCGNHVYSDVYRDWARLERWCHACRTADTVDLSSPNLESLLVSTMHSFLRKLASPVFRHGSRTFVKVREAIDLNNKLYMLQASDEDEKLRIQSLVYDSKRSGGTLWTPLIENVRIKHMSKAKSDRESDVCHKLLRDRHRFNSSPDKPVYAAVPTIYDLARLSSVDKLWNFDSWAEGIDETAWQAALPDMIAEVERWRDQVRVWCIKCILSCTEGRDWDDMSEDPSDYGAQYDKAWFERAVALVPPPLSDRTGYKLRTLPEDVDIRHHDGFLGILPAALQARSNYRYTPQLVDFARHLMEAADLDPRTATRADVESLPGRFVRPSNKPQSSYPTANAYLSSYSFGFGYSSMLKSYAKFAAIGRFEYKLPPTEETSRNAEPPPPKEQSRSESRFDEDLADPATTTMVTTMLTTTSSPVARPTALKAAAVGNAGERMQADK